MGNSNSTSISQKQNAGAKKDEKDKKDEKEEKEETEVIRKLNDIATHYILTMDFESLKNLHDQKYCDKLVVLTSNIMEQNVSDMEIKDIAFRIRDKDKDMDKDTDQTPDKKALCLHISKFYVKVAHIFSAILLTLNPVYTYTDSNGNKVTQNIMDKDKIPANANAVIESTGLCANRIQTLSEASSSSSSKKSSCRLQEIPELIELYYDSDYDMETGTFLGMEPETETIFKEDLHRFYRAFTQNDTVPESIQKFSDIKVKDYSCSDSSSQTPPLPSSHKGKLFHTYAENLKKMIHNVHEKQKQLMDIIDSIFETKKGKDIHIHSNLTNKKLQELIVKTRNIILELYLQCETDFAEGVQLHEAITESLILETSQNQLKTLERELEKLYR